MYIHNLQEINPPMDILQLLTSNSKGEIWPSLNIPASNLEAKGTDVSCVTKNMEHKPMFVICREIIHQ